MKLVNLHNKDRYIWKFLRDDNGNQIIEEDTTFHPFFYEPDEKGTFTGYDGVKLRKVVASSPSDIPKQRSNRSYSSNIVYTKNYMIHKVPSLELCPVKYLFIDIEVLMEKGDVIDDVVRKGNRIVTCISIYNSLYKSIHTLWIKDMPGNTLAEQEKWLLEEFISYFQKEKPDLWLSWNVDFDYTYLHNRYANYFSSKISPINQSRSSNIKDFDNIFFPAGISILDYLRLFKKVSMREPSYKLDFIAQKYFGEKAWGHEDFFELNDSVRDKNINDIKRMVKIEEKFKVLQYFDSIRRLVKVQWEDLYFNSFIIESLLFDEAIKHNVVLPNGGNAEDNDETFEGAIREAVETGVLFDIGKFDLASAYPNMIVNFCLDPSNIRKEKGHNTIEINGIHFEQNENTLCPAMVKKILVLKDNLKAELGKCKPDTPEYKQAKLNYDAIKAVVNSAFGAFGLPQFRLYDNKVAASIAFLVRDVLAYSMKRLEEIGIKVVYYDTDSIFTNCKDDIRDVLNDFVKDWGIEKYQKTKLDADFGYEGYFSKLFIVTICRYVGELVTKKGTEWEIKGVEMKRADTPEYSKKFQKELIDKCFERLSEDKVVAWINEEKIRIKSLPIQDYSIPCKLSGKEYKVRTITNRAFDNRKEIDSKFNVDFGELFYYVFVNNSSKDKFGKERDVIAFKAGEDYRVIGINWNEVIRRNILLKAESIFEAMGWSTSRLHNSNQRTLF